MFKQSGNIFIGFVATILILTVLMLVLSKKEEISTQPPKLQSELAKNLNEHHGGGDVSSNMSLGDSNTNWTKQIDITENPFGQNNSSFAFRFKDQEPKKSNGLTYQKAPSSNNLYEETPLGYVFPNKSGFLDGYPYNHVGDLKLTINNSINNSDLIVYIYRISNVNDENRSIEFSRAFLIKGKDSLIIDDLSSGKYSMHWLELTTGKAYQIPSFIVYKDNKTKYNQYFKFNLKDQKNIMLSDKELFYN